MKSWALAITPFPAGLGLTTEQSWKLTPREFSALEWMWAAERARYANTHFETKGTPFIPEDFLGGDRAKRISELQRSKWAARMENRKLGTLKPGQIPKDLPEWAYPRPGEKPYAAWEAQRNAG